MPISRFKNVLLAVALMSGCAALGSCYRHVVRAEGVGGDIEVYEPNVDEDDDADFMTPSKSVPSKTAPSKIKSSKPADP